MKTRIIDLFQSLHIPAEVIAGGSHSIGMAGPYSDREYYVIVSTIYQLFRTLRLKKSIEIYKDMHQIEADLLLTTSSMIRYRLFYVLGVDDMGTAFPCPYDPTLMRTTAIKMGLRAYLDAEDEQDVLRQQYLLSKAAIQLIYAYALSHHMVLTGQLFTPTGATALLDQFPKEFMLLGDTIALKFTTVQRDTTVDVQLLRQLIDLVVSAYMQAPWCARAYFWQLVFALRYGRVTHLYSNMDAQRIHQLYDMVVTQHRSGYHALHPFLLQTIVV